jgi:Tol biopolymer transport system component
VTRGTTPRPAQPAKLAQPARPPRYYAELEPTSSLAQVVVRATATGAVVARIANPAGVSPLSVAAAPGDRTFYAMYGNGNRKPGGIRIYRFRLGSSGIPTALTEAARGLVIDAMAIDASALSPDGSQLAMAIPANSVSAQPEIIVVSLRAGTYRTWSGGLARAGLVTGLASLSWTADGRSLVYLAQWCLAAGQGPGLNCTVGTSDAQVRELNAGSGGGRLDSGPVLLRQAATSHYIQSASNHYLAQALINPAGTEITAVVQSSTHVDVAEISVATGQTVRVLYRQKLIFPVEHLYWYLASDSTGKYLLFAEGRTGIAHGWIQSGRLRRLSPFGYWEAFTW